MRGKLTCGVAVTFLCPGAASVVLIAIGPSPPPHAARSLLAPQSKMVGECARRGNNGKKEEVASEQAGRRIAKHTHSTVGRSEGEKARRRLNGLTTFPLLLSSSHFAIAAAAAAAAAVDSAVPFSPPSLPSPFAFPPSLGGLRTLFYPPANAHWSRRAFPARSSNGASRPAAPFEAKTAESAIAARAPSFAPSSRPPSSPLSPRWRVGG